MSESVKNGEKTLRGVPFKRGNPGRPKGAKDKLPRTVKNNIEDAFKKLGGVEGLVKWAKKSGRNREKLYGWYFSMLPKNVDANVEGDINIGGKFTVEIVHVREDEDKGK